MDGAWLFTRGHASVRISRRVSQDGAAVLLVDGPGHESRAIQCADLVECIERQQQVERQLVAEGYFLHVYSPDRRVKPRGPQ